MSLLVTQLLAHNVRICEAIGTRKTSNKARYNDPYPTSLLKQPDRTEFEWKEWSNNQDSIHSIKSIQDNGHTTQETIWHLVNQWYKKLNAQPGSMIRALGYIIDPPSFLVIQDIYTKHQKALRQVKFKRKTPTSPTMKQDDQMLPFSPSQVSGRFLCQFWRWKKQTKGEFSTQIEEFFTSLEINLHQAFDTAQKLYQHNQLSDLSSTSILNEHMIHNAINAAEEQIVPQFISTVLLLYKDGDQNKVWNTTTRVNGCEK
ncbi:hypothetical protein DFH28DRAFT_1175390 [Melampsora americana]|nr:hypothetical protein DFH28DRAFT_1175390 [Melampsora americana]